MARLRNENAENVRKNNRMGRDFVQAVGEPKPRPERQNYPVTRWPQEHLTINYCLSERGFTPTQRLRLINKYRPDISTEYSARNGGRPLTAEILACRTNRAHVNKERRHFLHLVPKIHEMVKDWEL